MRGPGCALRPRVRRTPGQPVFGGAQVSRTFYAPRPDRPAVVAGGPTRRSAARSVSARWRCSAHGDARPRRRGRQAKGIVVRNLVTARFPPMRATRCAGHRRLWQRLFPEHERQGVQRHRQCGLQKALSSPTPATRRFTRLVFPSAGSIKSSSRSCPSRCGMTAGFGCPAQRGLRQVSRQRR